MITLDTSGLGALLNQHASQHNDVVELVKAEQGELIIPSQVMAEIAWYIETRLTPRVFSLFLADVEAGGFTLDCGEGDISRIRILVERYSDMPLGFADAAVIACAERHGGRVLTLDYRHFGVVARDAAITILP